MRIARSISVCLACAAMAALIVSCGKPAQSAAQWKDGAYTGKADGVHGEIDLTVTVAGGKITAVEVTHQSEAPGVSDLALQRVPQEIVAKQSTKVDAVSGASLSSKAIMAAAEDALSKAVKH